MTLILLKNHPLKTRGETYNEINFEKEVVNVAERSQRVKKDKPTLLVKEDLTPFGFQYNPDTADHIVREMLKRCKNRFVENLRSSELQRLAGERGQYPASIKGFPPTPQENPHEKITHSNLDRSQRFDFYPLVKNDFTIPGMGEPGTSCCAVDNKTISHFSKDFKNVRVSRIVCKRVECPRCYHLWIKSRAFEITLALEISSFLREERPFSVVSSIRPKEVYFNNWNWKNVNNSLFNRAYRRGKNIGIRGGFIFFHPFRIRVVVKKKLRAFRKTLTGREKRLSEGDVGFWRMIRKDVLGYGSFYSYVKFGPHVHSVAFGDPQEHTDPDFFIGIQEKKIEKRKTGRPLRLETTQDVVGKVMYLLTHCGVSSLDKIIQPTRRYGCMYDFQVKAEKPRYGVAETMFKVIKLPEELFGLLYDTNWLSWFEKKWLPEKCREIADLVDMAWSDTEGLKMKESSSSDDIVWLPIWKIYHCAQELREDNRIPRDIIEFFEDIIKYLEKFGRPPPILPKYELQTTPLYWAAGYLTGLEIPESINIVQGTEGEVPDEIINRADENQEQEKTIGKTLNDLEKHKNHLVKLLKSGDPEKRVAGLEELHEIKRARRVASRPKTAPKNIGFGVLYGKKDD